MRFALFLLTLLLAFPAWAETWSPDHVGPGITEYLHTNADGTGNSSVVRFTGGTCSVGYVSTGGSQATLQGCSDDVCTDASNISAFTTDSVTGGEVNINWGFVRVVRDTQPSSGSGMVRIRCGVPSLVSRASGGGHRILDGATPLASQPDLSFQGGGVTCSDGTGETVCTISAGSAPTIEEGDVTKTAVPSSIDFNGADFDVVDSPPGEANVSIEQITGKVITLKEEAVPVNTAGVLFQLSGGAGQEFDEGRIPFIGRGSDSQGLAVMEIVSDCSTLAAPLPRYGFCQQGPTNPATFACLAGTGTVCFDNNLCVGLDDPVDCCVSLNNGTCDALTEIAQAPDADLDDLADGSLSGGKVGAGINAANIDNGLIPAARVDVNHIDNLNEIAAAQKSGTAGTTIATVVGGAPAGNRCVERNVNGDFVEAGTAAACVTDQVGTVNVTEVCQGDGTNIQCDIATLANLNTALGSTIADGAHPPDTGPIPDCTGTELQDAAGTCVTDLAELNASLATGLVTGPHTDATKLPLDGTGEMTGSLIADEQGVEFLESDDAVACVVGDFWLRADLSENVLKKCQNGLETVMDTTGGTPAFSDITGATNSAGNAMVVGGTSTLSTSTTGTIVATGVDATASGGAAPIVIGSADVTDIFFISSVANVDESEWRLLDGLTILTGENSGDNDEVGVTTNTDICQGDGTKVQCDVATLANLNAAIGSTVVAGPHTADEVGAVTATVMCQGNGSQVVCDVATIGDLNTALGSTIADGAHTDATKLPLDGSGEMTGSIIADEQGVEFLESDDVVTCAAGDYWIRADLSEAKLKKCENAFETVLSTNSGATVLTAGVVHPTLTSEDFVVGGTAKVAAPFDVDAGTGEITTDGALIFEDGGTDGQLAPDGVTAGAMELKSVNGLKLTTSATECIVLNAGAATQKAAGTAALTTYDATNFSYQAWDLDSATDEQLNWTYGLPPNIAGTTATVEVEWSTAGCTPGTADDVCFVWNGGGFLDSDIYQTGTFSGTETFVQDTCLTTGDVMMTAATTWTHGYDVASPKDTSAVFQIIREQVADATCTGANDAVTGDIKLHRVRLCYEVDNVASGEGG